MNNINLYCNCFRNRINHKTEYNQKNLMLGSILYEPELKLKSFQHGFICDDTGDNISHLNNWFGQLTGLYWVWKNTNHEIIGTNTYRLFWGDYFLKNKFEPNTLYIPSPGDLSDYFEENSPRNNAYDQYSYCHGEINLKILKELSSHNKINIQPFMVDNLKHDNFIHWFNIFISEKNIFNKLCEILFDILFKFFSHYQTLSNIEKQTRVLDFLGERILHIIYRNIDYYIPNINLVTVPIISFKHSHK